jgi:hypothetical protein
VPLRAIVKVECAVGKRRLPNTAEGNRYSKAFTNHRLILLILFIVYLTTISAGQTGVE